MLDSVVQDVRYACRSLRQSPGFAAVAVLSLALGIGANTTIFSFLNAVLLRPLPFPEPDRLVFLREQPLGKDLTVNVHPQNFLAWRSRAQAFDAIVLVQILPSNVMGADGAEQVTEAQTTADLFRVFDVAPMLGRAFTEAEGQPLAFTTPDRLPIEHPVVILGHGYWQRRFGGDPAIVGQRTRVTGKPLTIVGVAPPGFRFGTTEPDLFTPLPIDPVKPESIGSRSFQCYARLRAQTSVAAAQAELSALAGTLAREFPMDKGYGVAVFGLHEYLVKEGRPVLRLLMGVVAVVLLIACVNLAGLLLARGIGRRGELAVRLALGASRARIVRQVVVESLVIAGLGGAAGLLVGYWATRGLAALTEHALTFGSTERITLDATCFLFTLVLSTMTALLFGLLPAWQSSRIDPQRALNERGRGATADRRQHRLRGTLVIAEVALAIVLLVGAGLLLRTFWRLAHVDLGFTSSGTVSMRLLLVGATGAPGRAALVEEILTRVESLPGVRAAGTIQFLPLSGTNSGAGFWLDGVPASERSRGTPTAASLVSRGYFTAMGIPVRAGRAFTMRDRLDAPRVVVVNESFVARYIPDRRALGKRITVAWSNWGVAEIIGIVGDVRHNGLTTEPEPTVFLPHAQTPGYLTNLIVRTSTRDPSTQALAIRRAIQAIDPTQAVTDMKTMEEQVRESLARPRLYAALIAAFALLAVGLAGIGLYGLIAYIVGQRTHEIGIRLALGAARGDVFRAVLRQAAWLTLSGVAAGVAIALGLRRLVAALLFGVTTTDGATYAAAAGLFLLIAFIAVAVPARRASRVDPMTALRHE